LLVKSKESTQYGVWGIHERFGVSLEHREHRVVDIDAWGHGSQSD
jgi:hypothetical protein